MKRKRLDMCEFGFGAFAGTTATVVSNPFEVVKTRLQLQGALSRSVEVQHVERYAEREP